MGQTELTILEQNCDYFLSHQFKHKFESDFTFIVTVFRVRKAYVWILFLIMLSCEHMRTTNEIEQSDATAFIRMDGFRMLYEFSVLKMRISEPTSFVLQWRIQRGSGGSLEPPSSPPPTPIFKYPM